MIELGCFDAGTRDAACRAYIQQVGALTRVALRDVAEGRDRLQLKSYAPDTPQPMTVAQVQRGLKAVGFFPGGKDDGICGYRTLSAIRLFQEYVRSVEGVASFVPDGRFGPATRAQLQRWISERRTSTWAPEMANWQAGSAGSAEYAEWIAFLQRVKDRRLAEPGPVLQKVNAFGGASDTRKVAQWDFDTRRNMHLVGIRRQELTGKFDDVFVLLAKGLVFKFQGSTEPGSTKDPRGLPFLVPGQHDYHFGWHQRKYLALRPQGAGVLVLRSKNNAVLDDADLAGALEPNASINIHWGGRGMRGDIKDWSEGCQVINGSVYINPADQLVDCSSFAALNNGEAARDPLRTRAAYNVLLDLVTALGSDLNPTVKYTLLTEADLALGPEVARRLEVARARVVQRLA
jgi:hypothetical protein